MSDLTAAVIARFVAELRRSGYRNARSWRGLGTLLGYLRRVGAVPAPASPAPSPITAEEVLLERYRLYLMRERGVCEQAADGYLRKVRRFLAWRASAGGARLEGLTAADVSAFVLAECPGRSTHWGRHLTVSLRSFLGFLHVDGVLDESLARAVPRVAGWRLAGLPQKPATSPAPAGPRSSPRRTSRDAGTSSRSDPSTPETRTAALPSPIARRSGSAAGARSRCRWCSRPEADRRSRPTPPPP